MNGKLIVIAGTDGSGKRTQTERLVAGLRREGLAGETLAFPQYGGSFFGEAIARYLRGEFGDAHSVSPYLASVLFALDRWEARDRLVGWLAAGKVVVCDRYVSANAGHQAARIDDPAEREAFLEWLYRMEYDVLGLPRSDLTVYLHVPWRVARELVGRKGDRPYLRGATRDIHEADDDHLARAEAAYEALAATEPGWRRIECVREGRLLTPEEIGGLVWGAVAGAVGLTSPPPACPP